MAKTKKQARRHRRHRSSRRRGGAGNNNVAAAPAASSNAPAATPTREQQMQETQKMKDKLEALRKQLDEMDAEVKRRYQMILNSAKDTFRDHAQQIDQFEQFATKPEDLAEQKRIGQQQSDFINTL